MTDRALVIESAGQRRDAAGARPDGSGARAHPVQRHLRRHRADLPERDEPGSAQLVRPRARSVPAGRPGAAYPVTRLGYMEVAQVDATRRGRTGRRSARSVAMTYGHRTGYARRPAARPHRRSCPPDLDPVLGHLRGAHGPDLRERPAARRRRGRAAPTSAPSATACAGGGSRGRRRRRRPAHRPVRHPPRRRRGRRARPDPAAPRRRRAARARAPRSGRRRPRRRPQEPLAAHAPATGARTWSSSAAGRTAALALALRLLRPQGTVDRPGLLHRRRRRHCSSARSSTTTG